MSDSADADIRRAAFDWLAEQVDLHGDVLPRATLARGFEFRGQRIPLVSPQGIFKPQGMELPLSITAVSSPIRGPITSRLSNTFSVRKCVSRIRGSILPGGKVMIARSVDLGMNLSRLAMNNGNI